MERANRTIGEALEGEELTDYLQAAKVISRLIRSLQRGAVAQCPGIPSACRLLPRQPPGEVRRATAATGRGPPPPPREKPTVAAAHAALYERGDRCLAQAEFCSKSVETKHGS
jgi:hypothetical protein